MSLTIEQREEQLKYFAQKYYVDNDPVITDAEYDAKVDELRQIYPNSSVLTQVGAPVDVSRYGVPVKHPTPMGSLSKASNLDALISWWEKSGSGKLVCSPKIDGCAVRLQYTNGELVLAATRGNGEEGQEITAAAAHIEGIPVKLAAPWTGEVRGEVYMRRSVFEWLNEDGANLKNPRNAAAGALSLKDIEEVAKRQLSFLAYGCSDLSKMKTMDELSTALPKEFRDAVVQLSAVCASKEDIGLTVSFWTTTRATLDYDIDGLVFCFCDVADFLSAGMVSNCPVGAVAYKFPTAQVETVVLSQPWTVGRTGKITPMAIMAPVVLAGTTVARASLGSYNTIMGLDLAVGDTVLLEKGGDIIPHIVRVTKKAGGPAIAPTHCSECGCQLKVRGAHLWCDNFTCRVKIESRALFYLQTIGIKGIGPSFMEAVCSEYGPVKSLPDLYSLTVDEVSALIGSTVIARSSIQALQAKKVVPLAVFLDALGIVGIGTHVGKQLAEEYETLEGVLGATWGQLMLLPGIQDTRATAIVEGLAKNKDEIMALAKILTVQPFEKRKGALNGLSFCLTGAMSKPRPELSRLIEAAGGEVKGSVVAGLIYLVQADASVVTTKSADALKKGVQVISEDVLLEMLTKESDK